MDVKRRLYFLVPIVIVALLHNAVHEATHYLAAVALGEPVAEFRFLTNGWLTSQVIYATPVAERSGAHWLVIAWLPAVLTTLLGYFFYINHHRWLSKSAFANAVLWFAAAYFLVLDPFYFGVLSLLGRTDVSAAQVVGWPAWPVQLLALVVLAFNSWLLLRLRRFATERSERYLPART